MKATAANTRARCDRCGQVRPYVLGSAFQGDGTATFRNLCGPCERIEKPHNEPGLFAGMAYATVEEVIDEYLDGPDEDPEPDPAQMGLFTSEEMRQY